MGLIMKVEECLEFGRIQEGVVMMGLKAMLDKDDTRRVRMYGLCFYRCINTLLAISARIAEWFLRKTV